MPITTLYDLARRLNARTDPPCCEASLVSQDVTSSATIKPDCRRWDLIGVDSGPRRGKETNGNIPALFVLMDIR